MDYVDPDQDLKGYQTLNLNNSFEDNSFMREVFYETSLALFNIFESKLPSFVYQ